jgi:hypothetical protein
MRRISTLVAVALLVFGVPVLADGRLSPQGNFGGGGTGVGSIAVTQTFTIPTVNLGTQGTIDWVAPSNTVSGVTPGPCEWEITPSKVGGGKALACGIAPILREATLDVSGGGASPSLIGTYTWTRTESMGTAGSTGSLAGFRTVHDYNQPTDPYGWSFAAPATTSQLVLRQYMFVEAMTAVVCTGRLSDGSATAVSTTSFDTPGAPGDGVQAFQNVWTYTAGSQGARLIVTCTGAPILSGSWASVFTWMAETLSKT